MQSANSCVIPRILSC